MLKNNLKDYFIKVSDFLCLLNNIKELVESNKLDSLSLDELKDLNIDDEILEQIISNKNFKVQYKTDIKPFIKYLQKQ